MNPSERVNYIAMDKELNPTAWIGRHPEGGDVLLFEPQRLQDYDWEPLWAESQLKAAGWRRCAEGQRVTQWCPMAEQLARETCKPQTPTTEN